MLFMANSVTSTLISWLPFAPIVLFVVFLIYRAFRVNRKRTEQLVQMALDMGFEYQPKALTLTHEDFGDLPLFQSGHSHTITHLMKTQLEEIPVQLFDYRYTLGTGKNASTCPHSVIAFELPDTELPYFQLQPENFFHRIISKMGDQDIDFDSHPKFSKQYVLKGKDEQAVRNYFTDEKLWFLEARKNLSIQGGGEWLVFYKSKLIEPEELKIFFEDAWGIMKELT